MGTFLDLIKYNLTPIQKGRWLFTSFQGRYSDSPKALSEKLHEIQPSAEIVWLVKKEYLPLLPDYVTGVDIQSPAAKKYRASAQIVMDNIYAERGYTVHGNSFSVKVKSKILQFFYKRKKQKIYTTWHGTPLKRMGRDQIGNNVTNFICGKMTGIFGNRFTADVLQRMTFDKMQTRLLGTPRNDILFSARDVKALKERLGLPADKKIILFAPTFRSDGKDVQGKNIQRSGLNQLQEMNVDRLLNGLKDKFGGDWALVCRFHYHVDAMVDWKQIHEKYQGKIINGNAHDDMSEYLACTDVLMTDASSAMFDFSLTKRPCFLYFPDLEYYENKERGFYMPISSLPYPLATDFAGVLQQIHEYDEQKYIEKVNKQLDDFGYVDDENSSQRIIEFILEELQ